MSQPDKLIRECTRRRFSLEPFLQISRIFKSAEPAEINEYAARLLEILENCRTEEEFLEYLESYSYTAV